MTCVMYLLALAQWECDGSLGSAGTLSGGNPPGLVDARDSFGLPRFNWRNGRPRGRFMAHFMMTSFGAQYSARGSESFVVRLNAAREPKPTAGMMARYLGVTLGVGQSQRAGQSATRSSVPRVGGRVICRSAPMTFALLPSPA